MILPWPEDLSPAMSSHCFQFLLDEETTPWWSVLSNRCVECSSSLLSFDKYCDCFSSRQLPAGSLLSFFNLLVRLNQCISTFSVLPKIWIFSSEPVEVDAHKSCVGSLNTVCHIDVIMLCLSRYSTLRDQHSAAACAVACSVYTVWSRPCSAFKRSVGVMSFYQFSAVCPLYSSSVDYTCFCISTEQV